MGLQWFRQGYEVKYCIGWSPITKNKIDATRRPMTMAA